MGDRKGRVKQFSVPTAPLPSLKISCVRPWCKQGSMKIKVFNQCLSKFQFFSAEQLLRSCFVWLLPMQLQRIGVIESTVCFIRTVSLSSSSQWPTVWFVYCWVLRPSKHSLQTWVTFIIQCHLGGTVHCLQSVTWKLLGRFFPVAFWVG